MRGRQEAFVYPILKENNNLSHFLRLDSLRSSKEINIPSLEETEGEKLSCASSPSKLDNLISGNPQTAKITRIAIAFLV